jgi:hypothetical protein
MQWLTNTANQRVMGAGRNSVATPYQEMINIAGNWRLEKKEDSGSSGLNTDGAIDLNRHSVAWVHTGTTESFYIDKVVTSINGSSSDRGPTTLDQFALGSRYVGSATSNHADMVVPEMWVADESFSASVIADAHDYLVAKHGGI